MKNLFPPLSPQPTDKIRSYIIMHVSTLDYFTFIEDVLTFKVNPYMKT